MSWVQAFGASSAAGPDATSLWQSLKAGQPGHRTSEVTRGWPGPRPATHRLLLGEKLQQVWQELLLNLSNQDQGDLTTDGNLGVILASTKGFLEDFAWKPDSPEWQNDPMTGLLEDFLQTSGLQPRRSLCLSNACSSSVAAVALAQVWLQTKTCDAVLLLSADAASSFVTKGFASLSLLNPQAAGSFSADRAGFLLGEAATALLLTGDQKKSRLRIRPVGMEAEGSAVTRPTESGASLVRAALEIPNLRAKPPQIVIAHGTGTPINDATEDIALQKLFSESAKPPKVTGSKWCVGHTLAASAGLDLINACQMLLRQEGFALANTTARDPALHSDYWLADQPAPAGPWESVMISALGFGGLHASLVVDLHPGGPS